MNSIVIALFATCIVSAFAQDCSAKFKAFHQCMDDSHKQAAEAGKAKFDQLKNQLDACYTNNGCTAPSKPAEGHRGNRTSENSDCWKALREATKTNFESCVKQTIPSFVFPESDDDKPRGVADFHGRFHPKDETKALDSCANKQAVRDCKRALFNAGRPSDDEKKSQFQARCDIKAKCQLALGDDCQKQMEQFGKVACECRQKQQMDQIRTTVKACQNVKGHEAGTHSPRPQHTCDEEKKDYCKLGFDAFEADQKKWQGGHH